MRSQSDYNESRSSIISRNSVYSDLNLGFVIHPTYKDILPITDIDAVKTSVKNLVLTNQYARPFQPDVYSDVHRLLFENANDFTAYEIKDKIETVIKKYEPRVTNVDVTVNDDIDNNSYAITVRFTTINNQQAELTFFLTRTR
jgi:phage baseplate assembly protein W